MGGDTEAGAKYARPVAAIYIYNLIVGVGCLTLPHAIEASGIILGTAFLTVIGLFGYMTATWVIESLAVANALVDRQEMQKTPEAGAFYTSPGSKDIDGDTEDVKAGLLGNIQGRSSEMPLDAMAINDSDAFGDESEGPCHIERRLELGLISELLLGRIGYYCFYVILCLYLFGDLSIYAVFVPQSLVSVTGSWGGLSEKEVYYIYLAGFFLITGPFAFFDFQKTKYFQFVTMFCRNAAFAAMVVIAVIALGKNGSPISHIKLANFSEFPTLFGSAIYAFMCHHSIPGLISPVNPKRKINLLFAVDFLAILLAYILLSYTAVFAYADRDIPSTYTTFFKEETNKVVGIILALYPVFTLTTNFPLICITLRNNVSRFLPDSDRYYFNKWKRIPCTLFVLIPPCAIAYGTDNVGLLVSITGSYPGLGIMFLIPATLVFFARRRFRTTFGSEAVNKHRSPFYHLPWVIMILLATIAALGLTIYNQVTHPPEI